MRVRYEIQAEVLQTDDVAVCELTISTQGNIYEFTEHSKRYVDDEVDLEAGRDVALGKALLEAAVAFIGDHV